MAGRVSKDWNLVLILASTSHILHHVRIDQAFILPVSRGVSRGIAVVVVAVFCWGATGEVWELCSFESFQMLLWLVVIMKVGFHVG